MTVTVICAAIWLGRVHLEFDAVRQAAVVRSRALATEAHRRQQNEVVLGSNELHYISQAEADRQIAAARTSYQDNAIHHCVSTSTDTYQLGPCRAPLVEAGFGRVESRQQAAFEQARMRQHAEARLRTEQQRFAALTGQSAPNWQPGYVSGAQELPRQRCARVKAERDEAYRLAGNNRSFDFIRHWDDVVYEACKDT